MRVLVGIIHFSGETLLERCLSSIAETEHGGVATVVFDTSPSGSGEASARYFGADWVNGSRNAGYAWAINSLADRFRRECDVMIVCNSDVEFMPSSVNNLARHCYTGSAVTYPVQLMNAEGDIAYYSIHPQLTRGLLWRRTLGLQRGSGGRTCRKAIANAVKSRRPIPLPRGTYGSGAVIGLPMSLWGVLPRFDERLFLLAEDLLFGAELESRHVPRLLCGDSYVLHEGGFRSGSTGTTNPDEAAISSRIAWQTLRIGASREVVAAQYTGLTIRTVLRALRNPHSLIDGLTQFRALSSMGASCTTGPTAEDGLRVAMGAARSCPGALDGDA